MHVQRSSARRSLHAAESFSSARIIAGHGARPIGRDTVISAGLLRRELQRR